MSGNLNPGTYSLHINKYIGAIGSDEKTFSCIERISDQDPRHEPITKIQRLLGTLMIGDEQHRDLEGKILVLACQDFSKQPQYNGKVVIATFDHVSGIQGVGPDKEGVALLWYKENGQEPPVITEELAVLQYYQNHIGSAHVLFWGLPHPSAVDQQLNYIANNLCGLRTSVIQSHTKATIPSLVA